MKKAAENKLASNTKLRSVNTKFWDDQYVIDLDPIEKLLFLYFLTNPLTNLAGVYEISLKRIAFDTGIDKDMVSKMIERFEEDRKILYRDGYIFLSNYQKNQNYNPKMVTNVENTLKSFPESVRTIYGNLIKNEDYSLYIPYRESESEREGEIKSEGELEDPRFTAHDLHSDGNMPLLTDLTDYLPKDINNDQELRFQISKVIHSFTGINPDQSTITQHFNLINKKFRPLVKKETSFRIFFECYFNFNRLPDGKRKLSYLYTSIDGKINDALIKAREESARKTKTDEAKEMASFKPNTELESLASEMSVN